MKKRSLLTLAVASSLLAATTVSFADTTSPTPALKVFSDVDQTNQYYSFISDLKQKGVLAGNPDGTFGPNDSLTRAAFATMIVKTFNVPISSKQTKFVDSQSHWGKAYIESAYEAGIVSGTSDTTFAPDQPLTREQAATMVWNYLKAHNVQPTTDTIALTTGSTDDWATAPVQNIISKGLFGPNEVDKRDNMQNYNSKVVMTRQSAAALIDLALQLLNPSSGVAGSAPSKPIYGHAGSFSNPIAIQKGLTVQFPNDDGTINRTTTVIDVLNQSNDTSNVKFDSATNTYALASIPVLSVVAASDPNSSAMKTYVDTMNSAAKLFSQVTFKTQGNDVTLNLPSVSGTSYHWKYYDHNAAVQVVDANTSTLTVPGLNTAGNSFIFFLDSDPSPALVKVWGRVDLKSNGNGSYSSVFTTIDIN